jgi:predicted dithiol-disulfide oxidoreductase (DUF899 family)
MLQGVGRIPEDHVFEAAGAGGEPKRVRLSELFAPGKDTLAIYSFMFGPERERSCPGCTHFLDGLDGASRHIYQCINLAVVAKSPLPRILSFAEERGWRWLQLLSTAGNAYDRDYFGDSTSLVPAVRKQQDFKDGEEWDMPILNVFRRGRDGICHFWGSALLYLPSGARARSLADAAPQRSRPAASTPALRIGVLAENELQGQIAGFSGIILSEPAST